MTLPENRGGKLERLDREAYDWVVRFAAGGAGPADLAALRQWAARSPDHVAAFDRATLLWKAAGPAGQELLAESGIRDRRMIPLGRPKLDRRVFLGGALAASVAGAAVVRPPFGLWPSWSELHADYRTEPGAQRRVEISDNILIELNTRTSIAVRSTGSQVQGIELISGEAAIAVVSDAEKAFAVTARNGHTMGMAGTRFNVRCEQDYVQVTCIAGTIQVEQERVMRPLSTGRQVRYSEPGMDAVVAVDPATVTAWQDGVVIFQSTPVAEVIAEVNRYRPGRVILTDLALGRRLFNARLPIENIGRVPGQIAELFGAREIVLPGGIVLLG